MLGREIGKAGGGDFGLQSAGLKDAVDRTYFVCGNAAGTGVNLHGQFPHLWLPVENDTIILDGSVAGSSRVADSFRSGGCLLFLLGKNLGLEFDQGLDDFFAAVVHSLCDRQKSGHLLQRHRLWRAGNRTGRAGRTTLPQEFRPRSCFGRPTLVGWLLGWSLWFSVLGWGCYPASHVTGRGETG
jgi:hypothetical protein